MTTLPTIPDQTLKLYSELKVYLPSLEVLKKGLSQAQAVLEAHNAGQDVAKEARGVRLALKERRGELDKTRKNLKEEALKYGQVIDGTAKPIREAFETLEAQMQEVEKHAEIQESKRRYELETDRLKQLREAGCQFPEVFKGLADMLADEFESLLQRERLAVIAVKAEAERVAKEAKLAEEARAKELADARASQAEAQRLAKEAQAKLDAERKANEAKLALAQAEAQKLAKEAIRKEQAVKAEAERVAKEAQAKLDAERKQREALEAEAKRKEQAVKAEAERVAKQAQAEAQRLAKAGDAEKLRVWATQLSAIIANAPTVKGEAEARALATALDRLTTIHAYFTKA